MYELIFNTATTEKRGAVKRNGKIIEMIVERPEEERIVGNIYKGRVTDVLPGMEAAFVDIGRKKNGYLHKKEIIGYKTLREAEEHKEKRNISEFITEGQEIVVQVAKEEFGDKGARLTENVSLPGKYTVYMPQGQYIGISKRMSSEEIREEWRKAAGSVLTNNEGIIVRTSGETCSKDTVEADIRYLREDWEKALAFSKSQRPPALIYQDAGMIERLLRDYTMDYVERIVIDHIDDVRLIKRLLRFEPKDINKVHHYTGRENVFVREGVEKELHKALQPKVWLRNGGFLMIEKTEALTVIDVNTGRFTGKQELEDTIVKTNVEAASEIAKQLRLRDISGIIVIDFIDMKQEKHKEKVVRALKEALSHDRTTTNVAGMSAFGLVEMTRKKIRRSLEDSLFSRCTVCHGSGRVLSDEASAYELERIIHEYRETEEEALVFELPRRVMGYLHQQGKVLLDDWTKNYPFKLYFIPHENVSGMYCRYIGSEKEAKRRWEDRTGT
ncbi:RNAse G [Alteribacillus persepolensis]|uniref:RNAse G n=1 Tax=Alteribacillus persepolensis TaxID=568899 RepID=A0A1G8GMY9_9BACI|nr:Rne/Rng family ribonuclease [Alteribacillus persepolensis]SDH95818.1 RNAse G [Alteribacillus persepolensis]